MTRIICLSLLLLALLAFNADAEELQLQAAVPGEAGMIALRVTLEENNPALMQNYSGLPVDPTVAPEPSAVPEPATLGLLGLGVLGLLAARLRRTRQ